MRKGRFTVALSDDKTNRRRPTFSVRTLVVVVTLVCCYLGLWETTKRRGTSDVLAKTLKYDVKAIAPLLVATGETKLSDGHVTYTPDTPIRRYYFWFFGYVAKLPYERELSSSAPPPESEDTGGAQIGIVGRALNISPATPRFKIIANEPAPGKYWCNSYGGYFG